MTLRVAMWSGPRNISTALLRAFGNRPDTVVCDEPLYAFYLATTGFEHPGAADVIAAGERDWRAVARQLTREQPPPVGDSALARDADAPAVYYQKHMAQHLLPEVERGWLAELEHVFLIRDPREMLLSFTKVMGEEVRLEDTGLPQQRALFEETRARTGALPAVLDARDVLEDPRALLGALCERLGIGFREEMLAWPAGGRASDGVWAPHWYDAVNRSTGFQEWRPRQGELTPELARVYAEGLEHYRALFEHRLTAS